MKVYNPTVHMRVISVNRRIADLKVFDDRVIHVAILGEQDSHTVGAVIPERNGVVPRHVVIHQLIYVGLQHHKG